MSAAELRQAAETLRERAAAATDAGHGWRVADLPGANEVWADRDAGAHDAFMVATTTTRLNPNPGLQGAADSAYIATMHPGVGLALAKWLDDIAAGWMWDGEEPGVVDFDGDRLTFEGSMDTHPLDLARLINGGAS